jgi:LacI family transcriptional regulator
MGSARPVDFQDNYFKKIAASRATTRRTTPVRQEKQSSEFAVIEAKYSMEEGGDACAKLMSRLRHRTAIVCGNDVLAVGAIKQA